MASQKIPFIEWPTVLVLLLNYLAFAVLCIFYHQFPWYLVLVAGSFIVALHGSLQHEVIHGHPTRNRVLNELLVFPSLWLWLPFALYRDLHIKHHIDDNITDPFEDPESYYVSASDWATLKPWQRACYKVRNTIAGRLLLGPIWACLSFWRDEIKRFIAGDISHLRVWLMHLVSVVLVLLWIAWCDIPLLAYIAFFAYPGLSLTLLRSFLEHQTDQEPARRTAVVQSGKVMGLLFLNNNLHAIHHEQPALPWYRLPQVWQQSSAEILQRNGGYFYRGYWQVIYKYLFSAKAHPRHPYV